VNILAIDTSSKYFSLVIASDEKILVKIFEPLARELSAKLVPVIDGSLKKAKLALEDIDYFGAGLGPGSFTALRIGLAAMKGLVFPFSKPIAGIPSLDILAGSVKEDGIICPVMDARRGLLFPINDLLARLDSGTKTVFLGDGVPLYRKDIEKSLGEKAEFAKEEVWYPLPENLLERVREKIRQGKLTDSYKLVPLYLYPKECQVGNKEKDKVALCNINSV
jgi:tRNA threonylcarbamoyladenosine biosynthesis protein TsaB